MDELKIKKLTEPVMFTIRVDKSIVDFYDDLARRTNRSRNELIGLALDFANYLSSLDCLCTAVSVTCAKTTTCFRRTLPPI